MTNSSSFIGLTFNSMTLRLFGQQVSEDGKTLTEGQFINSRPYGFVRVITSKYIFEGQVIGQNQNGLGTYTYINGTTKTSYIIDGVEYASEKEYFFH